MDVFGVFNEQSATRRYPNMRGSSSYAFGEPYVFVPPRRFYLGARVSF